RAASLVCCSCSEEMQFAGIVDYDDVSCPLYMEPHIPIALIIADCDYLYFFTCRSCKIVGFRWIFLPLYSALWILPSRMNTPRTVSRPAFRPCRRWCKHLARVRYPQRNPGCLAPCRGWADEFRRPRRESLHP